MQRIPSKFFGGAKLIRLGQISLYFSKIKGWVHCFSMQVVINKCFLLNREKKLAQIRLVVFEKIAPLIPKNDVTEPKARLL